jgi:uncharacterized membrane protein
MSKKRRQSHAIAKSNDGQMLGVQTAEDSEDILPCEPERLAQFASIYPDAPKDILLEYLARSASQRKVEEIDAERERKETEGRIEIAKTGQSVAFVVVIAFFCLCGVMIYKDKDIGILLSCVLFIGVLFAITMGRNVSKKGTDINIR